VSSRKQGTDRRRAADWKPTSPALDRHTYVPTADWLEILAGDNPHLRDNNGKPMVTVIGAAAGLERTKLTRIVNGGGLSVAVMGSLVNFLMTYRGYTEEGARKALFVKVTPVPVGVVA
jgi:hypothetical protein